MAYSTVSRNAIRTWTFDSFPSVVIPMIEKKIKSKNLRTKSGNHYKASHTRVNDVMIRAAMIERWGLPERNNEYGISKHSWQSLALATYKIDVLDKSNKIVKK